MIPTSTEHAAGGGAGISVVMATFNGARFLDEQLGSVLFQTVQPLEVIVCDDRSDDETVSIVESWMDRLPLKYYVNESRLGVVRNFQRACSLATEGNYIALCDQDDIWKPDKLEKSRIALEKIDDHSSPAMVYTDMEVVDENKKLLNVSFWNVNTM